MSFTGDERAQSVQVGAVLLFGVLIIAFSSYQAFAVPEQNRAVEFNHNQQVQTQMQDLRNAIVSVPGATSSQSVSVTLGTQYPSRAIARNPGPPSGSLRTDGNADSNHNVTVRNAQASGETGDYWTGNSPKRFNSGTLLYSPNYNVYGEAPTTYYEHSLAYNQFRSGTVELSGQTLVNGRDISIVTLNGSLSRTSSGTASVDVQPVSQSSRTVSVTDDGTNNVSISFLSRLPASAWNETLSEEVDTSPGSGDDDRYIADVSGQPGPGPYHNVTLTFERGVDYRLRMAKAGVGTRVSDEEATYLTNDTPISVSISNSETADLAVEARDDYNNPVSDRTVNATIDGASRQVTTNENGQATISVDGGALGPGTHTINTSLRSIDAGYNSNGQHNVTFIVDVSSSGSSGSSAYSVFWRSPTTDNDDSHLSDCSPTDCTWNVSADSDDKLTLRSGTDPSIDGATLDFAINDGTIGTINTGESTTGTSGEATTELTANANGTVGVYAASGGSSDVINITVENGGIAESSPTVTIDSTTVTPEGNSGKHTVEVTFTGSDTDSDITSYTVRLYDSSSKSSEIDSVSDNTYTGGQTTVTLTDNNNRLYDDPFYVVVDVTDSGGRTDSDEAST